MAESIFKITLDAFLKRAKLYHLIDPEQSGSKIFSLDLLKEISEKADLDGESLETIEKYLESLQFEDKGQQLDLWNESLKDLIEKYKEYFITQEVDTVNENDYSKVIGKIISNRDSDGRPLTFNTKDILEGDAGNAFEDYSQSDSSKKWVKPWYNGEKYGTSGDKPVQVSYNKVRGKDQVLDYLKDRDKLQFTNNKIYFEEIQHRLRLLMPQTDRRVIVEDLDRNFWVIGQVMTAVTAYLFGDDSPFRNLFDGILNEIVQLWENVEYQWAALALTTLKPCTDVHLEFFPMPNSSIQPYRKFDNINNFEYEDYYSEAAYKELLERIDFLKAKYTNSVIIAIPYIRKNNYQRNYFSEMIIPYICLYDRLIGDFPNLGLDGQAEPKLYYGKGWKIVPLVSNNEPLSFSPLEKDFPKTLYGAREDDVYYHYCYPAITAKDYKDGPGHRYYCALRVEPKIGSVSHSGNQLHIKDLQFIAKDGVVNILKDLYNKELIITTNKQDVDTADVDAVRFTYSVEKKPVSDKDKKKIVAVKPFSSYYLGEMPSYYYTSQRKPDVVKEEQDVTFMMLKVGDFLPEFIPIGDLQLNKDYDGNALGQQTYDVYTYGYGSQKCPEWKWGSSKYNSGNFDVFYNGNTGGTGINSKYQLRFVRYRIDGNHEVYYVPAVTFDALEKWGVEYATEFIKSPLSGLDENQNYFFATKIGVNYWTGASGPQWNFGVVCHLLAYDKETKSTTSLGLVRIFDGYWTSSDAIFSPSEGGIKWRRIAFSGKITKELTTVDGKVTDVEYSMTDGATYWFDHNTENGTGTDWKTKATMELVRDEDTGKYNLDYSKSKFSLGGGAEKSGVDPSKSISRVSLINDSQFLNPDNRSGNELTTDTKNIFNLNSTVTLNSRGNTSENAYRYRIK